MKIPAIRGIIDRRILINYRVNPEIVQAFLPSPFSVKKVEGKSIVGICLIRLVEIRPKGVPSFLGISSENAAHRIAVEWEESGEIREGVYIPRRDTSSRINSLVGGKIFPGIHHYANFSVKESNGQYSVSFLSDDNTYLAIKARETTFWNPQSVFSNVQSVSNFFEAGSIGYSPIGNTGKYEGLELRTQSWSVSPLSVEAVSSSFFENRTIFPEGSVEFDNALLMKNINHEWHTLDEKICQ